MSFWNFISVKAPPGMLFLQLVPCISPSTDEKQRGTSIHFRTFLVFSPSLPFIFITFVRLVFRAGRPKHGFGLHPSMRLANGFDARHCIYLGSIIHSSDAPSQWVWCSALASVSSSRPPLYRNLLLSQFCYLILLCKLQVMACPRDSHYHFCVADWRALRPGSYPSSIEQKKNNTFQDIFGIQSSCTCLL